MNSIRDTIGASIGETVGKSIDGFIHTIGISMCQFIRVLPDTILLNSIELLSRHAGWNPIRNTASLAGRRRPDRTIIQELLPCRKGFGWGLAQPLCFQAFNITLDFPCTSTFDEHRRAVQSGVGQDTGGDGGDLPGRVGGQAGLLPLLFDLLHRFGLCHPGADGVDPEVVLIWRGEVVAQGAHEANHAMLGCLIDE